MRRYLHFLGDVWLPRPVKVTIPIQGDFIFNLESPITRSNLTRPDKISLKTEHNFIVKSFGRPPLAVCLGNNHIMDYGPQGFADTLKELQQSEIGYFGAGKLEENCHNPLIIDCAGIPTALLSYVCETTNPLYAELDCPGVMPIAMEKIREDIDHSRANRAQKVIVNLHWGLQDIQLPRPKDITLAHQIIDHGADMIIGHHAHCIQPYQIYRDKYIFYGIGNCIFPYDCIANHSSGEIKISLKLRPWNRRSLLVSVDLLTMKPRMSLTFFNDTHLTILPGPANIRQIHSSGQDDKRYIRQFQRHARYCMARDMFLRFLERPGLVRMQHLRALFHHDREAGMEG